MEVNWNDVMSQVTAEVLKIMIPILVVVVLKWISEVWLRLKEQHPEIAELISYSAQLGYASAEDFFRKYKAATGEDKMEFAVRHAQDFLNENGISVDEDVVKDAITSYGVSNYKFSWTQSDMFEKFGIRKEQKESEEETEVDHGTSVAGDLRLWSVYDHRNADPDEGSEQPAGSGESAAAEENGK